MKHTSFEGQQLLASYDGWGKAFTGSIMLLLMFYTHAMPSVIATTCPSTLWHCMMTKHMMASLKFSTAIGHHGLDDHARP